MMSLQSLLMMKLEEKEQRVKRNLKLASIISGTNQGHQVSQYHLKKKAKVLIKIIREKRMSKIENSEIDPLKILSPELSNLIAKTL